MIGQTIAHYRILDKLGEGGMGEVYRARDLSLDREVALKVLRPEFVSHPDRLTRFEREARTLAALDHPNIVHLYSVEESAGLRFLTMQLVEGRSLSRMITTGGMPLERIFDIAIPLADALAAAHEKGIIHRDLKPSNIMVSRENRVHVLDFGLAKLSRPEGALVNESAAPTISLATEAGALIGTVGYMSPEQVRGEPIDPRSDIFSLGAVIHEMATGRRAFDARSAPEVLSAILRDDPPPVDELRPDLPHHLGRVIRRCLEKSADRRYQSAQEVRNELEDLSRELDREAILGSRSVAAGPMARPRRFRWGAALALLAAIIIAVTAAYRLVPRGVEGPPTPERGEITSLAVLPFDNLMKDAEQDYFVEGMHEALITDLSKIRTIRVISRTSVMRYKATDKPIPEIARELNVDALIEGSVLRVGEQVRITAQLIHGPTDEHIWAERYDRDTRDVLALLSEVARVISDEIEVVLTPEEEGHLASVRPVDPEAQEAYLRGRFFMNQFSGEGLQKSLEYFRQAIDLDPGFAHAWVGLSTAYSFIAYYGNAPAQEAISQARTAALTAIELDGRAAEAYVALGWVRLFVWDWSGAEQAFQEALELSASNPWALHGYGDILTLSGRLEEGLALVERSRDCDPFTPAATISVPAHLYMMRRYDASIAEARRLLELDPDLPVHGWLGRALWQKGMYEESLAAYRKAWSRDPERVEALERGHASSGPRGALREVAQLLEVRSETTYVSPFAVASVWAAAGEVDRALEWLERALDQRPPELVYLKVRPEFDPLRHDLRFQDLVQRMAYPG